MDTTLPGLMFMHTREPMSMRIHTGIIAPIITPIITPIDWEMRRNTLLETAVLVRVCLSALPGGGV